MEDQPIIETVIIPDYRIVEDRFPISDFNVDKIKSLDKDGVIFYARARGFPDTGMSSCEVALLYDLIERRRKCNIVELGRNFGCSTRLFIHHIMQYGGRLDSWDLHHWGNLIETFEEQGFALQKCQDSEDYDFIDHHITLRVGNSMTTPIVPNDKWVDFLLLDTEHSLDNALGEYMRWRHYMRDGSMIAFHDSTLPGPARAIDIVLEVDQDRIVRQWKNDRGGGGFGVTILEWR